MSFWRKLYYHYQYLLNPPWDTGITPPEVEAFVLSHAPGKALDLGCGTGTNVIFLARHGWQVTGVDFVASAIRQAQRKAQQAGLSVNLLVGDVTHPKGVAGPFDLILDIGCLHGLSGLDKIRYIDNLPRLLESHGTFLLYGFLRVEHENRVGLDAGDLERLSARLELIQRQTGNDRGRPSAWLSYRRPVDTSPIQ